MLSFSKTSGYAILALGCIGSWKGDWALSKNIHKCTGVPIPYLRKILFALGKAGLIEAKRGYQGGFALTRPAEEISLLDVVRAVEHEKADNTCLLALAGCSDATPCPMHGFWEKERVKIEARLSRVTIAQAAQCVRAARWGKLTVCPPPDYVPKRKLRKKTTGSTTRKGTAARKKAKTTRSRRTRRG
jgi:Rrf2 family protein